MAQKSEEGSVEEILLGNVYILQALINVLEKEGFISKSELLEELSKLKQSVCAYIDGSIQ
jgi:hypothetical protein